MKSGGETWTPICIPGISEEFLLHIYIRYFSVNFGIVIVSTDPAQFYECKEQAEEILQAILDKDHEKQKSTEKLDPNSVGKDAKISIKQEKLNLNDHSLVRQSSLIDMVDKCTVQMYKGFNMKELQLVLIKNNILG